MPDSGLYIAVIQGKGVAGRVKAVIDGVAEGAVFVRTHVAVADKVAR